VWNGDPQCGHVVSCAYQTHYCSYIRAPRLLTLQTPTTPEELGLIVVFQWYELWFKVLLTDLRAALDDHGSTFQATKLLRRGVELFRLFDQHADMAEAAIVHELGLVKELRGTPHRTTSAQFLELDKLSRQLPPLLRLKSSELSFPVQDYVAHLKRFQRRFKQFVQRALKLSPQSRDPQYRDWLHLDMLLNLQDGVKAEWTQVEREPLALMKPERISADENMFVIVHQSFEIWFKVILDHIDHAIRLIFGGEIAQATRLIRRVVRIQRLLNQQIQIPATMLPLDFMRFRVQRMERDGKTFITGLSPASGTESYQFREIEIACGLRDDAVFRKFLEGNEKLPVRLFTPRQAERLNQPSLRDAFGLAAQQRGIKELEALFTPADVPNPNVDLAELADTLIDLDEAFRLWRLCHVSMVEKMIGAKSGTGFLGPEYLMETAGVKLQEKNRIFEERQVRPRFFEELWAVRTRLGAY
jgi:tryptophan 2,3-dioxygenase